METGVSTDTKTILETAHTLRLALDTLGGQRATTLLTRNSTFKKLLADAKKSARSRHPVLITGESGTGKELVARYLHALSPRAKQPFVALNCGALNHGLAETALFGHVRGAYSGAIADRAGIFAQAHGGTILLDEIGELPIELQPTLLRVLQNGEFRPVGSGTASRADVRVIACTHQPLKEWITQGKFRRDLYHRLAVIELDVPPLRERQDDVEPLLLAFLLKHGGPPMRQRLLHPDVLLALRLYAWPGNVRELENEAWRMIVQIGGGATFLPEHLSSGLQDVLRAKHGKFRGLRTFYEQRLKSIEGEADAKHRELLVEALQATEGNLSKLAKILGVKVQQLHYHVKRLRVNARNFRPSSQPTFGRGTRIKTLEIPGTGSVFEAEQPGPVSISALRVAFDRVLPRNTDPDSLTVTGGMDPDAKPTGTRTPGNRSAAKTLPDLPPRYEYRDLLGRGGMGAVYLVYDRELKREVALKVLSDSQQSDGDARNRLLREIETLASLEHPNIVPMYDTGRTPSGQVYYTMRRLEGHNLFIQMSLDEALPLTQKLQRYLPQFLQVCQAIAYAHKKGVLHRDLKPANVVLGDTGEVYVIDWGAAKYSVGETDRVRPVKKSAAASSSVLHDTQFGTVMGTPSYMAPEQAAGRVDLIDARSDIYSLGALLYELLTGHTPVPPQKTIPETLAAVERGEIVAPATRFPELAAPPELEQLAMRCLSTGKPQRPQSAEEVVRALHEYLEGKKRREAAENFTAEGRKYFDSLLDLEKEATRLDAAIMEMEFAIKSWEPGEKKKPLWDLKAARTGLETTLVEQYAAAVQKLRQALESEKNFEPARGLLGDLYAHKLNEAEERQDPQALTLYSRSLAEMNTKKHAAFLTGDGLLTLGSNPPGADVLRYRFVEKDLILTPCEETRFGKTPLKNIPMPRGSYLLVLKYPGKRDTRYPVNITRQHHWRSKKPVNLYTNEEIGTNFCYVPAGPFIYGGDPAATGAGPGQEMNTGDFSIGRLHVTCRDYLEFLNDRSAVLGEGGFQYAPRRGDGSLTWVQHGNGQWSIPDRDLEGEPNDPLFPTFNIGQKNALAYAAWMGSRTGDAYRLPSEVEWEKAARGTDGRFFPWGNRFDPVFCNMHDSARSFGLQRVGAFAVDVSVYSVCDTAGNIAEWTASSQGDRVVARGGSWLNTEAVCRLARRNLVLRVHLGAPASFRLVRELAGRAVTSK